MVSNGSRAFGQLLPMRSPTLTFWLEDGSKSRIGFRCFHWLNLSLVGTSSSSTGKSDWLYERGRLIRMESSNVGDTTKPSTASHFTVVSPFTVLIDNEVLWLQASISCRISEWMNVPWLPLSNKAKVSINIIELSSGNSFTGTIHNPIEPSRCEPTRPVLTSLT